LAGAVRLTVLNIAYPFAGVGPDAVGGAEQVMSALDRALVRGGHRSIVISSGDSDILGEAVPIESAPGPIDDRSRQRTWRSVRAQIARVQARTRIDVMHFHGVDLQAYMPPNGAPALVTLHLPTAWYAPALDLTRPGLWFHGVSETQHRGLPALSGLLAPVPNGVPLDALAPGKRKGAHCLVLGRICPEKGAHLAIEAAKRAGAPLLVAGSVFPYAEHERYFREEVVPRLDSDRQFVGPIGLGRKRELLASARCLLVPSLAPETSSLVAMEALACGTPVIAFAIGALPEIVDHGRTGFLVRDVDEMALAITAASGIDASVCRGVAETRFSLDRMSADYLARYEWLARIRAASAA
jgi:glycosyltransferase involved in cell wall biosynthesis